MSTPQCLMQFDSSVASLVTNYTPFLYQEYEGSWAWEVIDGTATSTSANAFLVQCQGGYYIYIFIFGVDVMISHVYIDEPIISAFFGKLYPQDIGTLYMISENWVWTSQTWDFTGGGIRTRRNEEFETEYSLSNLDPINLIRHYMEVITGPPPYFGESTVTVDYEKYALTFNENSEIFYDDDPMTDDSESEPEN